MGSGTTPTPAKSVPLVSGAAFSSVFKNNTHARIDNYIFAVGSEEKPFVLEAWILPIPKTDTGVQKVVSHGGGRDDGLTITGKVIRFGTSYLTTGDAFCEYDLGEYRLAHVVGVHNADANELWVNGERVATVAITEEQKGDVYDITSNYLYAGATASTQEIAMNAVAIYASLSGENIKRNYEAGIDFIGQDRVYPQHGGVAFDLNSDAGSVFLEDSWTDRSGFERGLNDNVTYTDTRVQPVAIGEFSQPGSWTVAVPLDSMGDMSIYGVSVSWSGIGATVETSLDGSVWSPAKSDRLVPDIVEGMDPTGTDLQIRVSFDGGIANDSSYLERLEVVGFRDNRVENITARPVTVTHPAVLRNDYEPNLYRDTNGISLAGGTLTIGPDPAEEPDIARTLELWMKPLSGAVAVNVGGTVYRNGAADTTLPVGEWSLVHYVAAADIAGNITVSGDAIIGQATIYPTALSAAEVNTIWKSYTGNNVVRYTDTNTIGVSEDAVPGSVYEHDWSINAAG